MQTNRKRTRTWNSACCSNAMERGSLYPVFRASSSSTSPVSWAAPTFGAVTKRTTASSLPVSTIAYSKWWLSSARFRWPLLASSTSSTTASPSAIQSKSPSSVIIYHAFTNPFIPIHQTDQKLAFYYAYYVSTNSNHFIYGLGVQVIY